MNTPVLEVTNLSKNFGGLRALNEVDLTINRQEIVALIGPNGAGKTTFFNCITGIYLPTEGTVQLHLPERNGKPASSTPLNGMKPNEITSLGMARTFQNIRLWKTQTVFDNVLIAKHMRRSSGFFSATFRGNRKEEAKQREEVLELSYTLLRVTVLVGCVLMVFSLALVPLLFRPVIFPLFKLYGETASIATALAVTGFASIPLHAYSITAVTGVLRAGGDVFWSAAFDIGPQWLAALPLTAALALVLQSNYWLVAAAIQMESVIKVPLCLVRVHRGKWIHDVTKSGGDFQ